MAKKSSGKQIAITGVVTFGTDEEHEKFRRMETRLSPCIDEGCVYGIGLTYPPPGVLPAEEASVEALATTASGCVVGITGGNAAHLVWMPKPFQIADAGVVAGITMPTPDLVAADDGTVYGAGRDACAPVFAWESRKAMLTSYRNSPGTIKDLFRPFTDDGVGGLALSADDRTLAAVGESSGRICLYDLKTRKRKQVPCVSSKGEAYSTRIGAMPDGGFCVSGTDGELLLISPKGSVNATGALLPCGKGKAYVTRATAFLRATSGVVYGGTEEGLLFSVRGKEHEVCSHGAVGDLPFLRCLVEGAGGEIYGISGDDQTASHLVRFDPSQGTWRDLGIFESHGHFPWVAYSIHALAACSDGRIVAGEADRFGHIFAYHPPLTR